MITSWQLYLMSICGPLGRAITIVSVFGILISVIGWLAAVSEEDRNPFPSETARKRFIRFLWTSIFGLFIGMAIPDERDVTAMVIVPTAVGGEVKQDLSFETLNKLQETTNSWFESVRKYYLPYQTEKGKK